jgi:hypothetical protein
MRNLPGFQARAVGAAKAMDVERQPDAGGRLRIGRPRNRHAGDKDLCFAPNGKGFRASSPFSFAGEVGHRTGVQVGKAVEDDQDRQYRESEGELAMVPQRTESFFHHELSSQAGPG